jgi:hypothetical protein
MQIEEFGLQIDHWVHQMWDHVPKKCKHPLSTGHILLDEAVFPDQVNGTILSQTQCAKKDLTIGMKL